MQFWLLFEPKKHLAGCVHDETSKIDVHPLSGAAVVGKILPPDQTKCLSVYTRGVRLDVD